MAYLSMLFYLNVAPNLSRRKVRGVILFGFYFSNIVFLTQEPVERKRKHVYKTHITDL